MIEKLFTSKNRVKILQFLLFEKEETYLREISEKLNISVSAVKRETDNLKVIGLIELSERGIKLNKKCNFIEELKGILIKTDFIAYPLRNSLKKENIQYALIFGSFAKGNYTPESDIDLLIIGNATLSEVYSLLKPAEEKIHRTINPVVWAIENLRKEKNSGFVKDVFKKKIIMLKGDENELRKIIG